MWADGNGQALETPIPNDVITRTDWYRIRRVRYRVSTAFLGPCESLKSAEIKTGIVNDIIPTNPALKP